jgi:hypothetical protein
MDKTLTSIMGKPDNNDNFIRESKDIITNIANQVNAYAVKSSYIPGLYRQKTLIAYNEGTIELRYDKIFNNKTEYYDPYRTFLLGQATCNSNNKMDYEAHTEACLSMDMVLSSSIYWSDCHLREAELAGDSTDKALGHQMFMSLVPWKANIQGYEFIKGARPKNKWQQWGEHQYYHCRKQKCERNRQWHCYPKPYNNNIIYRTEFKMYRGYLKPNGLRHHKDILSDMGKWYSNHCKLYQPVWSKVPMRYRTSSYMEYPVTKLIKRLRDDGYSKYNIGQMVDAMAMPPLQVCDCNGY